jgi:signal-transduction protein with cAMP-binding, CBS, and nucleotidyltransferase domain
MLAQMLNEPVSKYTNHQMVTIDAGLTVQDAAKVMAEAKVDSILVYTNYNVIGIVTIKDMLTEIIAKGIDPSKVTIGILAHRQIIKINKDATVREAIDLMKKNDIRRLVVMNDERPIGLISRKALVGNMNEYDTPLPELEIPDKVMCPYCQSVFANKDVLSKHIDQIHIGKGLLEGNLVKAKI